MSESGPIIYVRKDNPIEKVKITKQERTPNGLMDFEIVEPPESVGRVHQMNANYFFNVYEREGGPVSTPNNRPPSWGTRDEWRAYALHLEKKMPVFRTTSFPFPTYH